jgi:cystathionine gamma-synthase/cystathionine gamma-lyase
MGNTMRFETRAIHDGQVPETITGAVIPPIYQTSTYQQVAIGKNKGYEYSRTDNPTRASLETALASIEMGKYGIAFSSGVAASMAVFSLLKQGDHIVASDDLYGGTYRLLEKVFRKWGISTTYANSDDENNFKKKIRKNTKLIWIETPTNPLLKVIDIKKIVSIARKEKIYAAVDNTFATPFFQNPIKQGSDIVVHSTTKYISGHSDIIGGAIITNNKKIYKQLKFYQNSMGAVPGPWDCYLTIRGIKTLAARMRIHEENALYLASYLSRHPAIEQVYYPGLKNHKNYEIIKQQMSGSGGMISIRLKGKKSDVKKFITNLKLFIFAESLGGVESLICHPASMTHASIPEEKRIKYGIDNNLVRLSVGIENRLDLKNDLENALS